MTEENRQFSIIGKSVPRVNGADKVRGRTQFTDDISLPGMIYGKIKPADITHGRIKKIDTSKAEKLPGVFAIITGEDTPIPYNIAFHLPTETPLAGDKVRYYGEGVAAVAAIDEESAEKALDLIKIEYEELPYVLGPLESMSQDKVRIHDEFENNVHLNGEQNFGDVAGAFKNSHFVLKDKFSTNGVNHGFLEPHTAIADYNPDTKKLTLHNCIQLPNTTQRILSDVLEMPLNDIRVKVPHVGGGFGGKTEVTPSAIVACVLSKKTGRPVKITSTRNEVFILGKGRHPSCVEIEMGFTKDGIITGVDLDYIIDGGAHTSWGLVIMWFSAALVHLPYKVENVHFKGRRILTNKPTFGAQRGVGAVQVRVPIECIIDEAGKKLGISPMELRLRNAVESGYEAKAAVTVRHSEFKKCLEAVRDKSGFNEKFGKLPFGRGIGLAAGHYSTGGAYLLFRSYRPHSTANVRIDAEAGVTVFTGITDIGQGALTVVRQMAAEVFGLDVNDINLFCQDTTMCPFDNGTYDSRVTYGVGHAVKRACNEAKEKLLQFTAIGMGIAKHHLECGNRTIYSIYDPRKKIDFFDAITRYHSSVGSLFGTGEYTPPQPKANYEGNLIGPSPAFGFTVQAIEIEVDTDTGHIKILNHYEAGDCGKALNPMSVEGQVEGGICMGIGQSLYEDVIINEDGMMINPNFHSYLIPGPLDMPEIESEIVESYDPTSAFGSKEIGEGPLCPVPPALMNAVSDAIGVRIKELPLTPEKVLKALGKI